MKMIYIIILMAIVSLVSTPILAQKLDSKQQPIITLKDTPHGVHECYNLPNRNRTCLFTTNKEKYVTVENIKNRTIRLTYRPTHQWMTINFNVHQKSDAFVPANAAISDSLQEKYNMSINFIEPLKYTVNMTDEKQELDELRITYLGPDIDLFNHDMTLAKELQNINITDFGTLLILKGDNITRLDPTISLDQGNTTQDQWVFSGTPDTNEGASANLQLVNSTDGQGTDGVKTIFIELNNTELIDAGALSITQANLSLYMTGNSIGNEFFYACLYKILNSASWDESEITYNNMPVYSTNTSTRQESCHTFHRDNNTGVRLDWDITIALEENINDTNYVGGYKIRPLDYPSGGDADTADEIIFSSKDHGTSSNRPIWDIIYETEASDPCDPDTGSDWIITTQCNISQGTYNFGTNIINQTTGGWLNISDGTNITAAKFIGLPQPFQIFLHDATSKLNIT